MLMTVGEFVLQVENNLDCLIGDLQEQTGRSGQEEREAWRESFPAILPALQGISDQDIHIHFDSQQNLSLEYRLPASFSFADLILLGAHDGKPAAVFVELKHWLTRADTPGGYQGLMVRQGGVHLHPSDQVKGYVEYCRNFHSAVLEADARVHGCVWFTRDSFYDAYLRSPNDELVEAYPCFSVTGKDLRQRLPLFLNQRLSRSDEEFAKRFEEGRYIQERSFVKAIGEQILISRTSPLVLLDNQRFAFNRCWEYIRRHVVNRQQTERCVLVIEGPPGSGKSVIAALLWATLVCEPELGEGSVVIATTSMAQNTSWGHLFEVVSGQKAARGAICKTNTYMPISTHEFGSLTERYPNTFLGPERWRENLRLLRNLGNPYRVEDQEILISIVDEAHALINPENVSGRGQFGFTPQLGPQAYHIMRGSTISIFLLDPKQNFRERENTSTDNIRMWAVELDAEIPDVLSLGDAQFRCNGSKEYVDWVEGLLGGLSNEELKEAARSWQKREGSAFEPVAVRQAADPLATYETVRMSMSGRFEFELTNSPQILEDALRSRVAESRSARLVASYAREWKTKDAQNPHDLPDHLKDFQIPLGSSTGSQLWTRIWNVVRDNDYSGFTQAAPGFRIAEDPLCEVGCPYAIRGFDFDYVGLLWFSDLVWRRDRWVVQPEHVHESGLRNLVGRARREQNPDGPNRLLMLEKVKQAYRILLTRAIRGVFLWVEDQETKEHIADCLIGLSMGEKRRRAMP